MFEFIIILLILAALGVFIWKRQSKPPAPPIDGVSGSEDKSKLNHEAKR